MLFIPGTYTVGLRFRFDAVSPGYRKIIDYRNRDSDTGFYLLNGRINFYPLGTSVAAFAANEVLDLLAVREDDGQSNTFSVFIIEEDRTLTKVLEVAGSGSNSLPETVGGGSLLGFFFDDQRTSSEATPGGRVYALKIWNRALTEDDLAGALDDPIIFKDRFEQNPP